MLVSISSSALQISWLPWEDAITAGSLTKKLGLVLVLNALRLMFITNRGD